MSKEIVFKILPHKYQKILLERKERFLDIVWGRRSGKTHGAVAVFIKRMIEDVERVKAFREERGLPPLTEYPYFYIAETLEQAKSIVWSIILTLVPPEFIEKKTEKPATITFINGAILRIFSAEAIDAVRGGGYFGGIGDEAAYWPPDWEQVIFPALGDNDGWLILISTARGFNHMYTRLQRALTGEFPDHFGMILPTRKVAELGKDYLITIPRLEALRSEMTDDRYRQEFDCEFLSFEGQVFPEFTDANIMSTYVPQEHDKVYIAADYGQSHPFVALWFALQPNGNKIIFREYYQKDKTLDYHAKMIRAMHGLAEDDETELDIHIDQSAVYQHNKHKMAGTGELKTCSVAEILYDFKINCIPTDNEIDANIQGMRMAFLGKKLYYTRDCPNLIRESQLLEWDKNGKPKKINDDTTDAARYGFAVKILPYVDTTVYYKSNMAWILEQARQSALNHNPDENIITL